MKMDDAIVEFGFDCKVRKLSAKTVANYQKQLLFINELKESVIVLSPIYWTQLLL